MRAEVARDMNKSTPDLKRVVIPILIKHCPEFGKSDIRIVESTDKNADELRKDLDILAGIDAYQRWKSAMRGVASRIQFKKNYRTFTIRESRPSQAMTEFEKRLKAVKNKDQGYIYPYWTIQAYMTCAGGDLLSVGLAKTEELYLYIEAQEKSGRKFPREHARDGGEGFLYVKWDQYKQSGNFFFEYPQRSSLVSHLNDAIEKIDNSLPPQEDIEELYFFTEETLLECEEGISAAERLLQERDLELLAEWGDNYGQE